MLIAAKNCMRQNGHKNFEVVAPERNSSSFILVIGKESSSLWACIDSH